MILKFRVNKCHKPQIITTVSLAHRNQDGQFHHKYSPAHCYLHQPVSCVILVHPLSLAAHLLILQTTHYVKLHSIVNNACPCHTAYHAIHHYHLYTPHQAVTLHTSLLYCTSHVTSCSCLGHSN